MMMKRTVANHENIGNCIPSAVHNSAMTGCIFEAASTRKENRRQLNPFRRKYALNKKTFDHCYVQVHQTRHAYFT